MSETSNPNRLGHPLRNKKKRTALFVVIAASIIVHVIGLGAFAVIKIVQTVTKTPPEFEAPLEAATDTPPPQPPPPPTQRTTQRSMPRPQAMAVQNPLNLNIPAIQINSADMAMGLTGRGAGGGFGEIGGGIMDSFRITSFGFDRMMEGTLAGTLYDFKQNSRGKPNNQTVQGTHSLIRNFTGSSWSTSNFDRDYFKADKQLFASYFIIPFRDARAAPEAFNAADQISPSMIGAVYTGTYKPQKSGRFRFYGRGDDVLIVRLNHHIVLDASWTLKTYSGWSPRNEDKSTGQAQFGFQADHPGIYGDWFNLREGFEVDIEIIISEVPGGKFGAWLTIEEKDSPDGPKIFSTRPLSQQDKDYLLKQHPDSRKFL